MDYKDEDELLKKENVAEEEFVYDEEAAEDYEANQVFMTPGQMVFRRFMRNRLAVVGICAIVFMFLFCFVGPLFSPYSETELFYML